MQYRHGDLLIESVSSVPGDAEVKKSNVIALGEATGHAHRLNGGAVLEKDGEIYLRVTSPATITHEEHTTIELPPGDYVVTRQREYDPYEKAIRQVAD